MKQAKQRALVVCVVALVGGAGLVAAIGPVSGQSYYNNSSGVVQSDVPENATLQNIVELAVELSPSVIGTGEQDPSGTGFEGFLLVGLAFGGVAAVMIGGAGVGPIGGLVLGSLVSYGLVDLGFAPQWVKPLLLFGIGILVFATFRKVLR